MKLGAIGRQAPRAASTLDKLAAARVEVARRNWQEIAPAERLVARPFGRLVDSQTDFVFKRRGGETFEPGRASLVSGEGVDLWFYLDRDGDVVVLERVTNPATWSEVVERREQRRLRAVR